MEAYPKSQRLGSISTAINGFFAIFFIAMAYAFIPSSNIIFIVKERESNVKHQQLVSGVGLMAYWFSNFLLDYVKFIFVGMVTVLLIIIYGIDSLYEEDHLTMTICLVMVFGATNTVFTYLISFMFKSPSSAQIFTFILNFFFGCVLMIGSFVLRLIESTRNIHVYTSEWVFRLNPIFNLSFGLLNMAYSLFTQRLYELDSKPKAWSWYGSIRELGALLVTFVVFFALIFMIELDLFRIPSCTSDKRSQDDIEKDDEEVEDEVKEEEQYINETKDLAIKVENVGKNYVLSGGGCLSGSKNIKRAVKNINFGVAKGECFGLLGTNGAGKTTTFKMLSGEIIPTKGVASINGYNVSTQMKKIRHLIGYCPQFDALLDKLTAREHLELYAAIKGIRSDLREKLIKEKLKQLNLMKFEHVQAGTYSGGNKRKLSVAMALLGNPPIIFLDEPSSGMDPEARRFMWTVVSRVSSQTKKSSVILTTHSMEEAEALSTKLAIMVEGNIKCIGPVQKLKNKYGKGFEVETKLKLPTLAQSDHICKAAGLVSSTDKENEDKPIEEEGELFLNQEEVYSAFQKMGKSIYQEKIVALGPGSSIYNELNNKRKGNKVSQSIVVEFIHIQMIVENILSFLNEKFGKTEVLESYLINFKFKVVNDVKLSALFGEMERNVSHFIANFLERTIGN